MTSAACNRRKLQNISVSINLFHGLSLSVSLWPLSDHCCVYEQINSDTIVCICVFILQKSLLELSCPLIYAPQIFPFGSDGCLGLFDNIWNPIVFPVTDLICLYYIPPSMFLFPQTLSYDILVLIL